VRRPAALALLLVVVLLGGACGGGSSKSAATTRYVALDGSARHPDAQGVVTKVARDFSTLDLDGHRYAVAKDLQSFATQDGSTLPLLQRVGSYVQVGLQGSKVVWLANIANVVRRAGQPDVVYYSGTVIRVSGATMVFRDGTVLPVASSLRLPPPPKRGALVTVTIDPKQHEVVKVEDA
jgi:hypothetical protein